MRHVLKHLGVRHTLLALSLSANTPFIFYHLMLPDAEVFQAIYAIRSRQELKIRSRVEMPRVIVACHGIKHTVGYIEDFNVVQQQSR